jgi:cysteine desulfurase
VQRIYLDYNATTPIDPRVVEAMGPHLTATFGNPSSLHWFGQQARAALDEARGQVAALLGAASSEIVFTASGTEADNLALRGVAAAASPGRRKILYSAIEHHAVLNTARALLDLRHVAEPVGVDGDGRLDLQDLRSRLDNHTALVSVMLANNETGVVQPVAEVADLAHAAGALFHCDAVQGAGKLSVDVQALRCDLLTISAHKIYGPKGVGALYVKRGTPMKSTVRGGAQERNRRAGTENVVGAVGFGRAADIARRELVPEAARTKVLRDRLEQHLLAIPGARRNGSGERVPNTSSFSFAGTEAEGLLLALDLGGLAVSTGAACAAGAIEPSHVLAAMGLPAELVQASMRFSLGRPTTGAEVDRAAELVAEAVERQRRSVAKAR